MKLKRLLVLAGVMALIGMLWASPAAADGHLPTITLDPASVPAEAGDVTLTVTGANWSEPTPFFIVACPGAAGDPDAPLTLTSAPEAIAMCPNLMAAVVAVEWDDGGFTTEWTVGITQADIDVGALVIMAGWLSVDTLSNPEDFATVGLLAIGEDDAAAEAAAAAEAEAAAAAEAEAAAAAEAEAEAAAAEAEAAAAEAEAEAAAAEAEAEAAAAEAEEPAAEELPVTGHESGLLVVVAASILAAGLLVIGAGRRVRTATR